MVVKSVGTFAVILVKLATPPLRCLNISPFLATSSLWGVGGRRGEPKVDQKIVMWGSALCNNYLEGFFSQIFTRLLLASIVEGKEIYFYNQEPIIYGVFLNVSYAVVFSVIINNST